MVDVILISYLAKAWVIFFLTVVSHIPIENPVVHTARKRVTFSGIPQCNYVSDEDGMPDWEQHAENRPR